MPARSRWERRVVTRFGALPIRSEQMSLVRRCSPATCHRYRFTWHYELWCTYSCRPRFFWRGIPARRVRQFLKMICSTEAHAVPGRSCRTRFAFFAAVAGAAGAHGSGEGATEAGWRGGRPPATVLAVGPNRDENERCGGRESILRRLVLRQFVWGRCKVVCHIPGVLLACGTLLIVPPRASGCCLYALHANSLWRGPAGYEKSGVRGKVTRD